MDRLRRMLVTAGFGSIAMGSGAVIARLLSPPPVSVTLGGCSVSRWGCQYQNIRLEDVARSDLDLIVLDPLVEGERLKIGEKSPLRLKPNGHRRLVLAYLCVGEAESYRQYWQSSWQSEPPSWLGPENERWPGSFAVRYWDKAWEDLLLGPGGALERILDAGFDGMFLDRVDAYGDWPGMGHCAQQAMIALVSRIAEVARARKPRSLIVSQNAEHLLADPTFCHAIDAVSKESLLFNLSGLNQKNKADDVAWSLGYIRKAQASGLPILSIEYLDDLALIEDARRELTGLGFLPFFGTRLLDRLP